MKKFLALLLIGVIIITLLCPISYVMAADKTENFDDEIALLQFIEVLQEMPGELELDITRADFMIYIARMLDLGEVGIVASTHFSDVPTDSWSAYAINCLYEKGIISADDEGRFHPDDAITFQEALKVVVNALGYGPYAEARGGYPTGYIRTAKEIELWDKNVSSENLTYRTAVPMMYKALQMNLFDGVIYKGDSVVYQSSKDKTLLSVCHGIFRCKGVLTAVPGRSLYAEDDAGDGEVIVDGDRYLYDGDAMELFAKNVILYYKESDNGSKKTACYMQRDNEYGKSISFDIEDFDRYDAESNHIYYTNNTSDKTVNISLGGDAVIVYNGTSVQSGVKSIFDSITKGTVRAEDFNDDGVYDAVVIDNYRSVVVKRIDSTNEIIYDLLNEKNPIKYTDNGERTVAVRNALGIIDISQVKVNDVLTVYESEKSLLIRINTESFDGKVETVFQDEDKLVISGNTYKTDKGFMQTSNPVPYAGMAGTFWLNEFGKIAYMKYANDNPNWTYGFLISAKSFGSLDPKVIFKIYTPSVGVTEFDGTTRITVDKNSYKNSADILAALKVDGVTDGQMIRYKTVGGMINEIDTANFTPEEDESNSLRIDSPLTDVKYRANRFGTKIIIGSSTVVISVPDKTELLSAEDYRFYTPDLSGANLDNTYSVMSYKTDKKSGFADVVVVKNFNDNSVVNQLAMVKDTFSGIKDGNASELMECIHGGNSTSYFAGDGFSLRNVKCGDLYKIKFNELGEIASLQPMYIYDDSPDCSKVAESNGTDDRFAYNDRVVAGYAYSVNDGVLKIYTSIDSPEDIREVFNISSVPVVIYDSRKREGNRVTVGKYTDIDTFDVSQNPAMVVIHTKQAAVSEVIVYQ